MKGFLVSAICALGVSLLGETPMLAKWTKGALQNQLVSVEDRLQESLKAGFLVAVWGLGF